MPLILAAVSIPSTSGRYRKPTLAILAIVLGLNPFDFRAVPKDLRMLRGSAVSGLNPFDFRAVPKGRGITGCAAPTSQSLRLQGGTERKDEKRRTSFQNASQSLRLQGGTESQEVCFPLLCRGVSIPSTSGRYRKAHRQGDFRGSRSQSLRLQGGTERIRKSTWEARSGLNPFDFRAVPKAIASAAGGRTLSQSLRLQGGTESKSNERSTRDWSQSLRLQGGTERATAIKAPTSASLNPFDFRAVPKARFSGMETGFLRLNPFDFRAVPKGKRGPRGYGREASQSLRLQGGTER